MTRYSVQHRYQKSVIGCRFLSFTENMGLNIHKNISENWSDIYSKKLLNYAKQFAADPLKNYFKKKQFKNSRSNWWFDW